MKRKHLQTDFVKFILEKYSDEGQELPEDDESENPDEENYEPQLRKGKEIRKINEFDADNEPSEDEEETQDGVDDEIMDELLNEYKRLKKKYESYKLSYRRKL